MARKTPPRARVRVLVSFNGMRAGDEADIPLDGKVQGWERAGLVVIESGTSSAGPGSVEPDADERIEE